MRRLAILATALFALALLPAAASAGTVAYSGDTLVITASSGEENFITLGGEQDGRLSISDSGGNHTFPGDRCEQPDPQYAIQCVLPSAIKVDLGDGVDTLVVDHMVQGNPVITAAGGPGNDTLKAIDGNTRLTLDGGDGNDVVRSEGGGDTLRGGAGNDELLGNAGSDVLEGGDGDDKLTGDACGSPGADVLDGGAGFDTLTDWGSCGPAPDERPVTVTVNGKADDGRPGEGDDVRDLDVLQLYVSATVIGTDGDQSVEIYAAADRDPSTVEGRGGADDLRSGSGRETLDGGAGDDRIEGGFNHDVLTGGPGKDVIYGDATGGNCGGYGQSCTIPFGNDTINARDGEADQIDCGPGEDKAVVDAADTVANCETVDGAGKVVDDGGGKAGGASLAVAAKRLAKVLRQGLTVRLAGFAPGSKVAVSVRAAGRSVARRSVKVGADGTARATLRFSRKARRALARKRSVKLVVKAGSVRKTVTVKR